MAVYIFRKLQAEEYGLLREFLYEAIFLPEGVPAPPRAIVEEPALGCYWRRFGKSSYDMARCAVELGSEQIIGIAWCRAISGFGYVGDGIPELAMAVRKEHRMRGIGTRLLTALVNAVKTSGCRGVSLAVQKENFAFHLYDKSGFAVVRETPEEYIMLYQTGEVEA